MDNFQKLFEESIKEHINSKTIVKKALREKFKEFGVEIFESKLDEITDLLVDNEVESLNLEIDDEFIIKQPEGFDAKDLDLAISDEDLTKVQENIFAELPKIMQDLSESTADNLLKSAIERLPEALKDRNGEHKKYTDLIIKLWGKPLGLLELFIALTIEFGAEFNNYYGSIAKRKSDLVMEVLLELFARGCQVASEVLVLLKSGFADGAHARWRTLHEMAVVAQFIDKHGMPTAERYLEHECIEDYKGAKQHQDYCKATKGVPLKPRELNAMKTRYDAAVRKYGSSFKGSYGWASDALGKDKPTFRDIEENIGLDAWRPIYKLASHNVHANPMGLSVKLGRLPQDRNKLLIGQSLLGLEEAGEGVAKSLLKIIATLLFRKTNIDTSIYAQILLKLEKRITVEFHKAAGKIISSK